ncbi:MAG: glucosaminidase domain-containing protein [Rikenellaceae bacterium]|nr:glucosaminidase domain-containing protein [Rikenellaceae bacterium]
MPAYKKALLSVILLSGSALLSFSQRISREEYILKYKNIAIEHMEIYGIPASIKMAQAILESDSGNSYLAKQANNHFGIKCRNDWNGETVYRDDDARNECFRSYDSVEESFQDHSDFLDNSSRYNFLFDLAPDDYKAWAHGLKQAGYATNPKYPELLINLIEDNKLYLLDKGVDVAYSDIRRRREKVSGDFGSAKVNVDNYTVSIDRSSGLRTGYNNGVPYVLANEGDNTRSIAKAVGLREKKLLKFNDLPYSIPISEGDALYIKQKKKRSENGYIMYQVQEGDTMYGISQKFGIRLKNLYKINGMKEADRINPGLQIRLR